MNLDAICSNCGHKFGAHIERKGCMRRDAFATFCSCLEFKGIEGIETTDKDELSSLRSTIEEQTKRIVELEAELTWVHIKGQLPKVNVDVQLKNIHVPNDIVTGYLCVNGRWYDHDTARIFPTHWRPEPLKEE